MAPVSVDGMPRRALLRVDDGAVAFGGVQALDGVSLEVREGSITGLIGPNGAGKTTLFNALSGLCRLDRGQLWLDGTELGSLPPHARARAGLGRSFQQSRVFARMTVRDNVLVGAHEASGESAWRALLGGRALRDRTRDAAERADELLRWVGLEAKAADLAENLSYGQQKLLALCQQLMAEPRVLLLDEPVAGVRHDLVRSIAGKIREISARGLTVLVIEHNMPFVWSLCDQVYVMAGGRVVASGTPEEVRRDETVLSAYLGHPVGAEV